jgi:hypothetical protein
MIARRQFLVATMSVIGGWAVAPRVAWPAWTGSRTATTRVPAPLPVTTAGGEMADTLPHPDDTRIETHALTIFDPAFALACDAATCARQRGERVLPLEGDAGTFWYRAILPFVQRASYASTRKGWREGSEGDEGDDRAGGAGGAVQHRIAVAGLTSHADFFVFSTLAASAGMSFSSRRTPGDHPALVAWHLEFHSDNHRR